MYANITIMLISSQNHDIGLSGLQMFSKGKLDNMDFSS